MTIITAIVSPAALENASIKPEMLAFMDFLKIIFLIKYPVLTPSASEFVLKFCFSRSTLWSKCEVKKGSIMTLRMRLAAKTDSPADIFSPDSKIFTTV